MLLWGGKQIWIQTDRKQRCAICAKEWGNQHPQCARPHALKYTKKLFVVRCEGASPRAMTSSLSPVELIAAKYRCVTDLRKSVANSQFG